MFKVAKCFFLFFSFLVPIQLTPLHAQKTFLSAQFKLKGREREDSSFHRIKKVVGEDEVASKGASSGQTNGGSEYSYISGS